MPFAIYKNRGETPLECLERLKKLRPECAAQKLSYAGRLDPLAEGVLVVLVGDECKSPVREKFLGLDKTYRLKILFGISTDTYDVLGLITSLAFVNVDPVSSTIEISVEKILLNFIGREHGLKYPPYSSKTIDGTSLFSLAKAGEIDDADLPAITGEIHSIGLVAFGGGEKIAWVDGKNLLKFVDADIDSVHGDFRQDEIRKKWYEMLQASEQNPKNAEIKFPIIEIEVKCQSGVYMRSLAHDIGKSIGVPALAYSIVRTQVGDMTIDDCLR